MALYGFGSGTLWGTALTDAFGNAIATPTPILFGVLQDVSIDMSGDVKELYGQNQFAEAVGRGKVKIEGKAKFGRINGRLLNDLFFGQTMNAGILADYYDTTGTAAAASITPTIPGSGTWSADLGVRDTNGLPMTRVASAPPLGSYAVSAGVYTFNASQTGTVFISFQYTGTSTTGPQNSTVNNVAMGYAPSFRCDFMNAYAGKQTTLTLFNAISTKLTFATKQDDFLIPEFDFAAFANSAGQILKWGTSE